MFRQWWHNLIQQDSGESSYHMLTPKWYAILSVLFTVTTLTMGAILRRDSDNAMCVKQAYTCEEGSSAIFAVTIPVDITGESYLYLGLSDFYSAYINIRASYSSIQLQGVPRNKEMLPYDGCDPISSLSDVQGDDNVFLPIDEFATDKNWRTRIDPELAKTMTLRPCGGLFYWIPTDSFTLFESNGGSPVFVDSVADLSWDDLDIPREPAGTVFPYIDPVTEELVWADPSTQRMRAWLRSNIHSNFILKAGTIPGPLKAGVYTVKVSGCRNLESGKYIKICTTSWLGYDQDFLSIILLLMGCVYFFSMLAYFAIPTKIGQRGDSRRVTLFN